MAGAPLKEVVHHLRNLVRIEAGSEQADNELLRAFSARNDQAAFASLVKRHAAIA